MTDTQTLYKDKNDNNISVGSVIDLHQTVNGENIFIIWSIDPLEVRYRFDTSVQYEYDVNELLKPSQFTGETEFEIVGNYNTKITKVDDFDNIIFDTKENITISDILTYSVIHSISKTEEIIKNTYSVKDADYIINILNSLK